jgi:hypothetical protein
MKLEQGQRKKCEACGADLIGARTKDGKIAPITEHSQYNGNVLLFKSAGGIECRTFAGATLEKLHEQTVPLRLNHFANCPHKERFERGKP